MTLIKARRTRPPLDQETLHELALHYVGKYATTRAKLRSYLARKLAERGWAAERQPDLAALADRFSELGYVDDAAYALSRSRSLSARGYGKRRLSERLRLDGVDEGDARPALEDADEQALDAALRFAKRRRLGPFSSTKADAPQRERWIAAMVRAGHCFALSRAIATLLPGAEVDREALLDPTSRI